MPPRKRVLESPGIWMARAKSNLTRARQAKPQDVFWEDLCFDAQQAAEKALKALLLTRGVTFRKTHDLGELMTNLEQSDLPVPSSIRPATALTDFAALARYPGAFEPATEEEYREALQLAELVYAWADSEIAKSVT